MKNLTGIGIFFIFLGFLFVAVGSLFQEAGKTRVAGGTNSGTKIAVGGFIGPIPFGWANDKRLFYPLIVFLGAMAVLWMAWQMMNK